MATAKSKTKAARKSAAKTKAAVKKKAASVKKSGGLDLGKYLGFIPIGHVYLTGSNIRATAK